MKSRIKKKKMKQQEQLRRIENLEAMLDNCMKETIRMLDDIGERLSHNTFVTNQHFELIEKKIADLSSKTKKSWFSKRK